METKICSQCGEEKCLEQYSKSKQCAFGRRPECKSCGVKNANEHRKEIRRLFASGALKQASEKTCPTCKLTKPRSEFRKNSSVKDGLSAYCSSCYTTKDKIHRRTNIHLRMLASARARSKAKGLDFSITKEDIFIPDRCPILGIPLKVAAGKKHGGWDGSPSLDRINNKLGYIPGNVIVISKRANCLKSDASLEELKAIASFYSKIGEQ